MKNILKVSFLLTCLFCAMCVLGFAALSPFYLAMEDYSMWWLIPILFISMVVGLSQQYIFIELNKI